MHPSKPDTQALFKGDWRTAPQLCTGSVEIWDQTVGCPECQMNLWYLPTRDNEALVDEQPRAQSGTLLFPPWVPQLVIEDLKNDELCQEFRYEPFLAIFNMAHPFQFDDCHDPGDEDDGDWPALELYLKAIAASSLFGDGTTE